MKILLAVLFAFTSVSAFAKACSVDLKLNAMTGAIILSLTNRKAGPTTNFEPRFNPFKKDCASLLGDLKEMKPEFEISGRKFPVKIKMGLCSDSEAKEIALTSLPKDAKITELYGNVSETIVKGKKNSKQLFYDVLLSYKSNEIPAASSSRFDRDCSLRMSNTKVLEELDIVDRSLVNN